MAKDGEVISVGSTDSGTRIVTTAGIPDVRIVTGIELNEVDRIILDQLRTDIICTGLTIKDVLPGFSTITQASKKKSTSELAKREKQVIINTRLHAIDGIYPQIGFQMGETDDANDALVKIGIPFSRLNNWTNQRISDIAKWSAAATYLLQVTNNTPQQTDLMCALNAWDSSSSLKNLQNVYIPGMANELLDAGIPPLTVRQEQALYTISQASATALQLVRVSTLAYYLDIYEKQNYDPHAANDMISFLDIPILNTGIYYRSSTELKSTFERCLADSSLFPLSTFIAQVIHKRMINDFITKSHLENGQNDLYSVTLEIGRYIRGDFSTVQEPHIRKYITDFSHHLYDILMADES